MANLKGKQKKLDANKDGKISGEDFKLLQDIEKRNPKFLGGLIKSIKNKLKSSGGGTGSEDAQMFLTPLPSYPNQVDVDRQMFALGGFFSKFAKRLVNEVKEGVVLPKSDSVKQLKELGFSDERIKEVLDEFEVMSGVEGFDSSIDDFIKYAKMELRGGQDVGMDISRSQEMAAETLARKQLRKEGETDISPDITRARMRKLLREGKVKDPSEGLRGQKAEGGEIDDQMNALAISVSPAKVEEKPMPEEEQTMLPDEEMEEDYVEYVMDETLSTEDQQYLNAALEKDAKLSEIFDQVVESATEFTGSGPIEGPGTAKSDSIPARLSDGEFVFTTKATEEIGSDNLMSMMKEAEAAADKRQMAYEGGMMREEKDVMVAPQEPVQQNINVTKTTLDNQVGLLRDEEDLVGKAIKENMMLDPYQRHVRS